MSKQFCRKDSTIHGVGRLAKVLCDGLSLKGMGEALCIEAAGLFWWPYTGDRVGTHPYTGVNLHRYLWPLDAEGFCDKHSTLLLWHTRPEVWSIHQNHKASSRLSPSWLRIHPFMRRACRARPPDALGGGVEHRLQWPPHRRRVGLPRPA